MNLRECADIIIRESIHSVLPDEAVRKALTGKAFGRGKLIVVAAGKAAYRMAKTAEEVLGDRIDQGIVITKYGHVEGQIPGFTCYEAGHPVVDENSVAATEKAIELVQNLSSEDTVLFLLSGGGSALFEKPLIPLKELQDITGQLLACGADIREINIIRKRLSAVKGGKFALIAQPAQVFGVILNDVVAAPLDMIASGPTYPDSSTSDEALEIVEKYKISLSEEALECLKTDTPKELPNSTAEVSGSVEELTAAAAESARRLGFEAQIVTNEFLCEAKEAGKVLSSLAIKNSDPDKDIAFIAGGETVVHVTGNGKGGRNQELALSTAMDISGYDNIAIFSVGSDGTDGPTDAAGGYVDGKTAETLNGKNINITEVLKNNDSYNALKECDGLIITGPTGTNVNDLSVALVLKH